MEMTYFGDHGSSAPMATPMVIISIFLIYSPGLRWRFSTVM